MRSQEKLLVTGASGHLGQRVIHHLLNTLGVPADRVIAATRSPARLDSLASRGVAVRAADFDNAVGLNDAFRGAGRILIISTDALDRPGRRIEQHRRAIDAAVKAGVGHVIYTSMPKPKGSPLIIAPDHEGTEQALAASALPGWTVLRNHWYFENLHLSLSGVLASGTWFTATENGRSADIARDDLARAAATILAGTETDKRTYTLSGPQALTVAEMAKTVGEVFGKTIEVVPVTVDGLIQGMIGAGLPAPVAAIFASFDTNTAAGRAGEVTGDVKRITGVRPTPFATWLRDNKASFGA